MSPRVVRTILINVATCGIAAAVVLVIYGAFFRTPPPKPVMPKKRIPIFRPDDRLGFAMTPNAICDDVTDQYTATYTLDEDGNRVTPDPPLAKGRVVILGCSFTFGQGVNDNQAYPCLLGRDYWPQYKMVNRACMAYGTSHAWLACEQELKRRPALVVYAFINGHVERSYIGKSWLQTLAQFETPETGKRRNPWLEIENGRPVFKGVVGPEKGVEPSNALWEKSKDLVKALVVDMDSMCRERKVPFFFVNLPTSEGKHDNVAPEIMDYLRQHHVACIDLQELNHDFYPDCHPRAPWHQAVAKALAANREIRGALGM